MFLILCLVDTAWGMEQQFTLGVYWDSNPIESISNPEGTFGIKLQQRMVLSGKQIGGWTIHAVLVGQGFLEPVLFLDSKLVANGVVNLHRELLKDWIMNARLETFQKLYFGGFDHHSRSAVRASLGHQITPLSRLNIGLSGSRSHLNIASTYTYYESQGFATFQHMLGPSLSSELSVSLGQLDFVDLPARELVEGLLIPRQDEDQRDLYGRLLVSFKFQRKMIWGVSLSQEKVVSNSVIGDANIFLLKLYASQRLGQDLFIHLVLQGMDKHYDQQEVSSTNPYRDPEEIIQNQIHCQIEHVFASNKTLYFQYGYLKNETIFNRWFYEKHLFEAGLKLNF